MSKSSLLPSFSKSASYKYLRIAARYFLFLRAPLVQMVARFVCTPRGASSKFSTLLVYFVPPDITHRSIPYSRACLVARFTSFVKLHLGRKVKHVCTVRPIYGNRLLFRRRVHAASVTPDFRLNDVKIETQTLRDTRRACCSKRWGIPGIAKNLGVGT